ncbi:MAG: hypothetical protein AAF735_06745 [Myxococcota bacterium]
MGTTLQTSTKLLALHDGRRPVVAMLVCPGMTVLDVLAPQAVLSLPRDIHLVWKNTGLIKTDSGVVLSDATLR